MINDIDMVTAILLVAYFWVLYIVYMRPKFIIGTTFRFYFKLKIVRIFILLVSGYMFFLYYLNFYQYSIFNNYDSFLQIIGEIIGVISGLILAFYYDRTHERISYVEDLENIFLAMNIELEENMKVIEPSFKGRANYSEHWQLLKTTTWDVYKERLSKAPYEWVNQISKIYYYVYILNDKQIPKDIRTGDFVKLLSIANELQGLYNEWEPVSRKNIEEMFNEIWH